MTGWAAGLTAAPCGALRICAGRPGRRSVDHGLVSDRARGTDRVHGGGARDDGTDLEAGIVRRVSGHTAAAAGAARSAGQGDRIRAGGEPEEPRNRWVRGGGGRDEPGHALRPWALCLAADGRATVGRDARSRRRHRASFGASPCRACSAQMGGRRPGPACSRGTGFSSGDRAAARGRIRREGELSRLARPRSRAFDGETARGGSHGGSGGGANRRAGAARAETGGEDGGTRRR